MQTRFHRYAVGVAAVSAAGVAALALCVVLVLRGSEAAAAADDGEVAARDAARRVRVVLEDHVKRRGRPPWTVGGRPVDPSESGFPTSEVFGVGGVEAIAVRSPDAAFGPPTFATDPAFGGSDAFVPSPAHADEVRVVRDHGTDPSAAYVAAFQLPASAHRLAAATVNLRWRPPDPGRARRAFEGDVYLGAVGLFVVIYLLGMLSYFIRLSGQALVFRDREVSARLKAVREVSGGIAHELRNPLNAIGLSAQVIERKYAAGADREGTRLFERVHLEIGRIKKVVDAFVKFARLGDLTVAELDLRALVRDAVAGFGPVFKDARIEAVFVGDAEATIRGDKEKLGEAVNSLLQTAVEAMRETGGKLEVRVAAGRREARLTVRDSGPTLDEARLRNVFEPYRYGRDQEGFGLMVAKTIVESHGGRIEAASPSEGGCLVTVTLPRRFV